MRISRFALMCSFALTRIAMAVQPEDERAATSIAPENQAEYSIKTSDGSQKEALRTIVIAAQKYVVQPIYDVPNVVNFLSNDALRENRVVNLDTLQFAVPGLYVESNNTERRITLQGISNISGAGGLVGEYVDDADVTSSPSLFGYNSIDLRAYDLAQVEVLKGPQGTLYGEGSEGGVIHYVTEKPNLNRSEVALRAVMSFTKDGAPSQEIYPVLNLPLSSTFGLRVAGEYAHEGGWLDVPAAHENDFNSQNLSDTRIEALWRPDAAFKANLLEIIHSNDYRPNQGGDTKENVMPLFGLQTVPSGEDKYDVSNIRLEYDVPEAVTIVNSATYYHDHNLMHNYFAEVPIAGTVESPVTLPLIYVPNNYNYTGISDEFRIQSNVNSSWKWAVGGFYKKVNTSNFPSAYCIGGPTSVLTSDVDAEILGNPQVFCSGFGQKITSKQLSGFADTNYKLLNRMTVGVGVRYFTDRQQNIALGAPGPQEGRFISRDPRIYMVYELSKHINAYANASKGFRSGGFNGFGVAPFNPEDVWHYELGAKTRGLESVSIGGAIFYSAYRDYQAFVEAPITHADETINAGTVHIKGGDLEVEWRPLPDLSINVNGEYVNGRFTSIIGVPPTPYDVGDPLDLSPRYQFNGAVTKEFRVAGRPWHVRLDYSQRSKVTYRNRLIGEFFYGESNRLYLLGLDAGVQWTERIRCGLTFSNLLDDRGYVDPFVQGQTASRIRPLTVGVYVDGVF